MILLGLGRRSEVREGLQRRSAELCPKNGHQRMSMRSDRCEGRTPHWEVGYWEDSYGRKL